MSALSYIKRLIDSPVNKHLKPADNQLIKGIFKKILLIRLYLGIPFSDTKYLSVS
ncbi:hypothetical protein RG47T_4678 [Mucilaginibacter polytrichastri]|uniref:Uncharacterized protein n=1 Tax=Mucilaginibacter polytrichastri TaxID=1302689 RepID=A0A1Q6A5C2_9SPHI|nr:hypothetical protein RG47T_4678 [Mucilaginibacter polytrichastri]SFS97861.1 hypothetical protein SAMN04487890_107233 [Mucilaginibacter polytrichastri]